MIGLPIDEVSELIASAAIKVAEMPPAEAWARIPITLAAKTWVTSELQHKLRPFVWLVRKDLKRHLAAHPELTREQIQLAAREIAETVM
jgi:hypothetical protein